MPHGWSNGTPTYELVTPCSGIEKTCSQMYNTERPHNSLGYLTPEQFARALPMTLITRKLKPDVVNATDAGP
jgi:hypothetical protein